MQKHKQYILHVCKIPTVSINAAEEWLSYPDAKARVNGTYGLGFVFTKTDPFFVIDIDDARMPNGRWASFAAGILQKFEGAYIETSMSGQGLHIIGSYTGAEPTHLCKNKQGIELYTSGRFIALTEKDASGDSGKDCTKALNELVREYFSPPLQQLAPTANETSDLEDEEVIKNAKNKINPFSSFNFNRLWERDTCALGVKYPASDGREYDYSSADAGLAQHLAFWTGGNKEQIIRIMLKSALVREKWNREDYLDRTVNKAITQQKSFYSPKKNSVAKELTENKPVQEVLNVPVLRDGLQFLSPQQQIEKFKSCVYVLDIHRALTATGELLKPDQFRAMHGGYIFAMDALNSKTTTNAWTAFTESQAVRFPRATTQCFRPRLQTGEIIAEGGRLLVNSYLPIDTPRKAGDPTPFLTLLQKILPDPRDQTILTSYLAACIQYKGVKFQWAPLLQGVEGCGKTIFINCVIEAIGRRYIHTPNPEDINNKFNAWLLNKLFVGVEEIYVREDRQSIIETLKPMITSTKGIEIQAKGVDQITADICANFFFTSNHKDAIRKTKNDRRFCIFYCAQQEEHDLKRDGMDGNYFPDLYDWLRQDGYAIVHDYLATYAIPDEFNPARTCHRAPITSTTQQALQINLGYVEQEIMDAIEENRSGFKGGWVSSIKLAELIKALRRSVPANKRRDIMTSLGYNWHPCLKEGRATTIVMPDDAKPVLFIKDGHPDRALKIPAEVCKAYATAQLA
jgi:hypothetical protein